MYNTYVTNEDAFVMANTITILPESRGDEEAGS